MTEEHKQKISKANKGVSRNKGKIWITDGSKVTRINKEDFTEWEKDGFCLGKKLKHKPQVAWNKGLTKDDPRVKAYLDSRKLNT